MRCDGSGLLPEGPYHGPKGEKKHIRTTPNFFEPMAKALIKNNPDITIISESPKPYEDAMMMKNVISDIK